VLTPDTLIGFVDDNSVGDRMRFPETPEQMHALLVLEERIKCEAGGFTHYSFNGYIIYNVSASSENGRGWTWASVGVSS